MAGVCRLLTCSDRWRLFTNKVMRRHTLQEHCTALRKHKDLPAQRTRRGGAGSVRQEVR